MLKSYLKSAIRNLRKHPVYTLINVIGLSVGIASCIFILLFVRDELSYDGYHEKAGQIFRITLEGQLAGNEVRTTRTCSPLAATLVAEYPDVLAATRLYPYSGEVLVSRGDEKLAETRVYFADSTFLEIFTHPFRRGEPARALAEPNTIVLTEAMAVKYFGDRDPLGQMLTFRLGNREVDFKVTGVCETVPLNSHFHFDFLASLGTLAVARDASWLNNNLLTYILLRQDARPDEFAAKLPALIRTYVAPEVQKALGVSFEAFLASGAKYKYVVQPLSDIHMRSHLEYELEPNGNAAYVAIFSAIALFILLLACINFINLATARSANRAKEVGIRKVVGSHKAQLVRQFLAESMLMSLLALALAVLLVFLLLPQFNDLASKQFTPGMLLAPRFAAVLLAFALVVGLLAGIYPALFLSSFRPVEVLKGRLQPGAGSAGLRRGLVVFQFAISIALIIGTFVAGRQLDYVRQKNLGFDKEHVVVLQNARALQDRREAVEHRMRQLPGVVITAATQHLPGHGHYANVYRAQDAPERDGYILRDLRIGYDVVEALDMQLVAGRSFSREFGADRRAYMINEAAVRKFGWKKPIGMQLSEPGENGPTDVGEVIGVVKDFHFESLHSKITPAVMRLVRSPSLLVVRIEPGQLRTTLPDLQRSWKEIAPDVPFSFTFLDEDFDKFYRADQRVGTLFGVFSVLGTLIACLGLFGLASYAAEKRTREFGIRKVLGASATNIVILLSREFTLLVGIAFFIAAPIAYLGMQTWLQNFAYRTSIGVWPILVSGLLALLIAWLTVSYQSIRAALTNPSRALKYE